MKTQKIRLLCVLIAALFQPCFIHAQSDTVRWLEDVIITDSRASEKTPLSTTTLDRKTLDERKGETSMSYIIESEPSIVTSGENGKMGNTSFRIRGVDATRINVNINGITLNEAESQQVFWVNIPNLAGMAQSLQLQRGIGASTGGTAAFGGALNIQTLQSNSDAYARADMSLGSWNTRQYGIAAGTGIGTKGWAADFIYSSLASDGYVRGGFCDHQSLFATLSHATERSLLKAIVIAGKQRTGITWDGAMAEELDADPRYNGAGAHYDNWGNVTYYDNESDNYDQQHYQLYYTFSPNAAWTLNATADLTHGYGYYEQYKDDRSASNYGLSSSTVSDFITRKKMLNNALTGMLNARYQGSRLTLSWGETLLHYHCDHFGNIIFVQDPSICEADYEWYRNEGIKEDVTSYLRASYDLSEQLSAYADLQYRWVDYTMEGLDEDLLYLQFNETYSFFNPKAGMNYAQGNHRLFAVAGLSHREPTRADIKDALYMNDTVRAEAMLDIETGYTLDRMHDKQFRLTAGGYAMLYHDQLTASGRLSPSGYALMENVDRSYRIGVELSSHWSPLPLHHLLELDGNVTLSSNKVLDYLYNYTDYEGNRQQVALGNTDLSFSPNVVAALAVGSQVPLGHREPLKVHLTAKYVGEMYCDNTSRPDVLQPDYFLLNGKISHRWVLRRHNGQPNTTLTAELIVNNILNNHYRLPAWTSDYYDETGSCTVYRGYYQQPGINLTGRVVLEL